MQVTIYIRKEVEDKFRNQANKSELINKLLAVYYLKHAVEDDFKYGDGSGTPATYTKVSETVVKDEPFVPRPPDPLTGYPCCEKAKPCKHWQWDGNRGVWVNELTGKTREVV